MRTAIRHSLGVVARVLLALVIAVVYTQVLSGLPSAFAAPSSAASDVKSISVRAYQIKSGTEDTWDVHKEVDKKSKVKTITESGGQIRLAVSAQLEDDTVYSEVKAQAWENWGHLKNFTYTPDSEKYLEVNSRGVVTAKADGTTKIRVACDDKGYEDLEASITIKTENQGKGLQVSKVEIVDKNGKSYGDDTIKIKSKTDITKLYAKVTYKDRSHKGAKVVYTNRPGAPASQRPKSGAFDSLTWKVSDTVYATVSNHVDAGQPGVGYLKAIANAHIQVFVSIAGGDASKDAGMGYGVVVDKVPVTISIAGSAGKVNGEDPADKLKVDVVYEKDPDRIYATETFTVAQFEALGAVTKTYTLTRSAGKYVTDRAHGVPIATLLQHMKVDASDVKYFTLAANDGANPGRLTAKWLVRTTRYYFPNYDIGGSTQEKQQVPSMLALSDSWNENTTITGKLNSGTRFRLVFGSSSKSDNATSKSVKFINNFIIVLEGAPSSKHGTGNGNGSGKTIEGGTGTGTGSGTGSGGGKGTDAGQATPGGGSTIGPKGSETSPTPGKASVKELDQSSRWRIYQMMNKSNSDIVPLDTDENPLYPFVIPAIVIVLVGAGLWRYLRFRRALR